MSQDAWSALAKIQEIIANIDFYEPQTTFDAVKDIKTVLGDFNWAAPKLPSTDQREQCAKVCEDYAAQIEQVSLDDVPLRDGMVRGARRCAQMIRSLPYSAELADDVRELLVSYRSSLLAKNHMGMRPDLTQQLEIASHVARIGNLINPPRKLRVIEGESEK